MTTDRSPAPTTDLTVTRDALHQVAEHVVAAAQFVQTGSVRLAYAPGGFTTFAELSGQRHVTVVGNELVIEDPVGRRVAPLTTVREAAALLGARPGLPASAYAAATPLRADARLDIDPAAATLIADWYGLADAALRALAAETGEDGLRPTLWPEHFDLAITIDDVNFGASPGDEHVDAPYIYVGPHGGPPVRDDFWNVGFGAVRTFADVRSPADALAFYRQGRSRTAMAAEDAAARGRR